MNRYIPEYIEKVVPKVGDSPRGDTRKDEA